MALVKVGLVHGAAASLDTDVVAIAVGSDDVERGKPKAAPLKELDRALDGVLASAIQSSEFDGKSGSELALHTHGKIKASHVVLLGVGAKAKLEKDAARLAGSRAVKAGEKLKAAKVALVFPFADDEAVEAAAEGVQLGAYRFDRYLSEKKSRTVKQVELVTTAAAKKGEKQAAQLGVEIGEGVNFARDLVNEPASVVGPEALADAARTIAREGGLEVEVLDKKQIEKLGMNLFLGVSQGSVRPPKLVHVWWEPPGDKKKSGALALVGKAITFDSGGLSIKSADGMMTMKCDMAGSAAVLGAMKVVSRLKPEFAVHGFLGACENMPSGTAQRPGDVVRGKNGKTVEVLNTDAEGRLVLADVLAWAVEHEPAAIVDLATLTGAIAIALGPYTTGLYATDEKLATDVLESAKKAGEAMWRMPLLDDLKEQIKSPIADLKNTGGRHGGSITAALFLREFVADVPWVHLDIAGPAFTDKERGYDPRGATGHGVRTLLELIRRRMA